MLIKSAVCWCWLNLLLISFSFCLTSSQLMCSGGFVFALKKKKNYASLPLQDILGRLTWVRPSSLKSSATHSCRCVQYFPCVQTMLWLPALRILNMHTDVAAWDCAQGLYGHCKRLCTGSGLWEKLPLPTGNLNPHQYYAWLFSQTLSQLSYPHPWTITVVNTLLRDAWSFIEKIQQLKESSTF